MGRLLFVPVGVAGGFLAGLVGKSLFEFLWSRISDEEAPEPEHRDVSWPKLVAALALEGAIFRVSRGLFERGSRAGFQRATGRWPGEERPEAT
jgi:hypothetical protein